MTYNLKTRIRSKIYTVLLDNADKGINVSQIAKKTDREHGYISDETNQFEKEGYCRVKYVKGKHGVAKVCFPSVRVAFEALAQKFNIEFKNPDEVYENIDKFVFHPDIFESIIKPELNKHAAPEDKVEALFAGLGSMLSKKKFEKAKEIMERTKRENPALVKIMNKGINTFMKRLFSGLSEFSESFMKVP
ncbi:MAG: hypothetical protein B6U68_02975 [Candidatus Aenigmarchaeota archaeon ex4484_14]|nr:MAG: hypothetical protein B6U68_02975 [Candidatus Aenigmarchaeota archaeon ex4484_14]